MKLLGSNKRKVTKDENGENMPNLEITEAALIPCNVVNNNNEQDSRFLYTFISNKTFRQLLDVSPKTYILLKISIQNFHILKSDLLIKILNG